MGQNWCCLEEGSQHLFFWFFFFLVKILGHCCIPKWKEDKSHDAEGKPLLWGRSLSWDVHCTCKGEGGGFPVVPGMFSLIPAGNSPAGLPRGGLSLAREAKTQFGPKTSTEELAQPCQRFAVLQTNMPVNKQSQWTTAQKTTQKMCMSRSNLHGSTASEIKGSFTPKVKESKFFSQPFLEGIYVITYSSIKLNLSFPQGCVQPSHCCAMKTQMTCWDTEHDMFALLLYTLSLHIQSCIGLNCKVCSQLSALIYANPWESPGWQLWDRHGWLQRQARVPKACGGDFLWYSQTVSCVNTRGA